MFQWDCGLCQSVLHNLYMVLHNDYVTMINLLFFPTGANNDNDNDDYDDDDDFEPLSSGYNGTVISFNHYLRRFIVVTLLLRIGVALASLQDVPLLMALQLLSCPCAGFCSCFISHTFITPWMSNRCREAISWKSHKASLCQMWQCPVWLVGRGCA